jgi:hypothetical protein
MKCLCRLYVQLKVFLARGRLVDYLSMFTLHLKLSNLEELLRRQNFVQKEKKHSDKNRFFTFQIILWRNNIRHNGTFNADSLRTRCTFVQINAIN